jgi:hypothetical protein
VLAGLRPGARTGSQPPPDGYVVAPVLCSYSTDTVESRDGDTVPVTGSLDAALFGVGYSQVTTKKIFGSRHERASPRVS